jgi:hypothetical protein
MKRIKETAAKNSLPAAGKSPAHPKYTIPEKEGASAPQLSEAETRGLARLVRKYGVETVTAAIAAAKDIRLRGPGRPSRGLLPYFERMHMTEWIEGQAEEHRQRGSTKPYTEAETDTYQMLYDDEKSRDLERFCKTIKKTRLQGRRDLIELLQAMLKHPLYAGRRDLMEKLQHLQKVRSYQGRK